MVTNHLMYEINQQERSTKPVTMAMTQCLSHVSSLVSQSVHELESVLRLEGGATEILYACIYLYL